VAEVESLQARAPFAAEPGRCIGYAEALAHLAGRLDAESMAERIVTRTRQLVRKQRMFLASFPEVRWIDVPEDVEVEALVNRVEEALELSSGGRSG
jgi:tRNA dimethylallyltransferase